MGLEAGARLASDLFSPLELLLCNNMRAGVRRAPLGGCALCMHYRSNFVDDCSSVRCLPETQALERLKQGAGVWLMHGQAGAGSPEVRVILRQALLVLENAALCRLTMAVANRLGGLAFGLLEAFFVKFYQHVVDPAPAGSWPFRFFEFLAKGPLKCARPLHPLCCGSPASQALTCRPRACPCALKCFL